jgi:hypothetical protein
MRFYQIKHGYLPIHSGHTPALALLQNAAQASLASKLAAFNF